MTQAVRNLLDQAQTLSEEERLELATELVARLGVRDPGWDAAWSEELQQRLVDVRAGRVRLVEWAEVRQAVNKRLQQR
ncbi:MAG: addiction module protein [Proteobacteria bacterium]|jgi:hypothetical protein|nr:addiction module protein [Pseudomonadota bacterium]